MTNMRGGWRNFTSILANRLVGIDVILGYHGDMAEFIDIFEGIVQPDTGGFSAELAQHVLSMRFSPEHLARYQDLSERVKSNSLSTDERKELDAYLQANAVLGIMKAKARRSLIQSNSAA